MHPTSLERLRATLNALAPIPDEQWHKLVPNLTSCQVDKGHDLVRQGEPATTIFMVDAGLVKTYFTEPNGHTATKGFAWERMLAAPYVAMLTGAPANFGLRTLEPSTLIRIPASLLGTLFVAHACWETVRRKITEGLLIERERREYQMLTMPAAARYEAFLRDYAPLHNRLPLYEIASYLGITAVALSNIRGRRTPRRAR